jgi:hypothetical protein
MGRRLGIGDGTPRDDLFQILLQLAHRNRGLAHVRLLDDKSPDVKCVRRQLVWKQVEVRPRHAVTAESWTIPSRSRLLVV